MERLRAAFPFLLWDETDQAETFEVSVDVDILGPNPANSRIVSVGTGKNREFRRRAVMISGQNFLGGSGHRKFWTL